MRVMERERVCAKVKSGAGETGDAQGPEIGFEHAGIESMSLRTHDPTLAPLVESGAPTDTARRDRQKRRQRNAHIIPCPARAPGPSGEKWPTSHPSYI